MVLHDQDDDILHRQMLRAHADQDLTWLVALYSTAGRRMESIGNTDAACFYLTQAYVFALELNAPELPELQVRLAAHGRIHCP